MPLYDMECPCGNIFEVIAKVDEDVLPCPECGKDAKRILSPGGVNTFNNDAGWIKSVLEVVDKDSRAPHVIEFRKNPTRENYHRWMKKEGLRPMDPGEERSRREAIREHEQNRDRRVRRMMEGLRRRRRIEVRSHA